MLLNIHDRPGGELEDEGTSKMAEWPRATYSVTIPLFLWPVPSGGGSSTLQCKANTATSYRIETSVLE